MKQIGPKDSVPRHEAISALKKIAENRNDAFLMHEIEAWIQMFVVQFNKSTSCPSEMMSFLKDPVEYTDYLKKKALIELGAGASNVSAEIFQVSSNKKDLNEFRFRMLALRPAPMENEND